MIKFFTPKSKVQKDRAIMRETDARLAKYSRRGLIFNFLAFVVLLIGGDFVERQQGLAIILTIGLLFFTALRGFFLFRFEALYPRAPSKWRNSYFWATLLGATWWGVILVSVTLVLQMQDEAPLLWLYTVVFFSTTAHAFAPYQRFLTVYQFMGQVPAAMAAFFIPDINAWLYAVLLLAFYMMLVHQCRLMSEDYWQKLSATYALAKKTENLEEEKRGTRAITQLNQEFMNNLHSDLSEVVQLTEIGLHEARAGSGDTLTRLQHAQDHQSRIFSSVDDFRGLLSKELTLSVHIFNVRHEIQALIAEALEGVEDRQVQIESALSPTIPMRLQGDAARFSQIIRTVLATITKRASHCFILVEADFLREFETSGDLQVTVTRHDTGRKRLFRGESEEVGFSSLDLSVCKGLADAMDGTLAVAEEGDSSRQIRFRTKFTVPEVNSQLDFHKDIFAGHSILLVHNNSALIEVKRRELDALGLEVRTESQFRRAYQTLVNSYRENAPIECVLFYVNNPGDEALDFSHSLLSHRELRNTQQLIACSDARRRQSSVHELVEGESSVHLLAQPAGLYEVGMALYEFFMSDTMAEQAESAGRDVLHLLLVDTGEGDSKAVMSALQATSSSVDRVPAARLDRASVIEGQYDMILMTCAEGDSACPDTIARIRQWEQDEDYTSLLPIVAVGWHKVSSFYEKGFDHFIDLNQSNERIATGLRYWASL